jgi:hypothetical protein
MRNHRGLGLARSPLDEPLHGSEHEPAAVFSVSTTSRRLDEPLEPSPVNRT